MITDRYFCQGIVFSLIVVRVAAGVSHGGLLRKQNGAGNTSVSTIAFRHSVSLRRPLEPLYLQDSTKYIVA